ncbi:steroid 21-hydroxylase-like isoform X3 [Corvus kubaryi]|uniref:steroid 21-hydroxylase-like isoform X3 n=1 Tax=Corvus kubaryi TaxID=68294 RepID=UPI001C041D35|nr:steroid 21-hydroxylase-like isoform X3 [Corvus kubaryi]
MLPPKFHPRTPRLVWDPPSPLPSYGVLPAPPLLSRRAGAELGGDHPRGAGPALGGLAGASHQLSGSCVPMGRPPWTPLRCSPSIPAAPLHASSSGTWCPLRESSGPSPAALGSCCRFGGTAVYGHLTCCPRCGGWGSLRSPYAQALPNPGLRKLLQLVQHRDTFVEAQIRRHQECPSPPPDTVLAALLGRDPRARGGPLSPPRLHMALVDLFIGGTETTAAALGWAVAFLLHRPELQARLRAELAGAQGPPGPGDMGRLPLLQATVSETLRLRPPAPLALPHCALRHTSLGGLPVVAGTVLVPNLLAAQQDPDIWQHPEAFLPERFLAPGAPSRSLLPFGCGARSCPGEGLARAELFVFLGLILREFRLEPGPGGLPGLTGSPGTVLRCPPYRLRMVPCQPPGSPSPWPDST